MLISLMAIKIIRNPQLGWGSFLLLVSTLIKRVSWFKTISHPELVSGSQ